MVNLPRLKVFYRPEMVAPQQGISPSPQKPALLVEQWARKFVSELLIDSEWRECDDYDLYGAHDPKHVQAILAGRKENGFGNVSPEVVRTLRWTTGSIKNAALWSLISGENSCSPTSGFHHAGWDRAGGFCTFNGLIVAAQAVARISSAPIQVGILDADMHYGDGTQDIMDRFENQNWLRHWSIGESWYAKEHAPIFMEEWHGMVETFLTFPKKLDLLLYQAGADPHVDDPLGGWLTTAELKRRDRVVFEQCRRYGVPVVWNLAGGYQEPIDRVLEIHTNTMTECLDVLAMSMRGKAARI